MYIEYLCDKNKMNLTEREEGVRQYYNRVYLDVNGYREK